MGRKWELGSRGGKKAGSGEGGGQEVVGEVGMGRKRGGKNAGSGVKRQEVWVGEQEVWMGN